MQTLCNCKLVPTIPYYKYVFNISSFLSTLRWCKTFSLSEFFSTYWNPKLTSFHSRMHYGSVPLFQTNSEKEQSNRKRRWAKSRKDALLARWSLSYLKRRISVLIRDRFFCSSAPFSDEPVDIYFNVCVCICRWLNCWLFILVTKEAGQISLF